jgi:hypothetical protein
VKPHVFHPEADEEYTQAVRYYAAVKPELGGRFYDEIERLIPRFTSMSLRRTAGHHFHLIYPLPGEQSF